MTNFLTNAALYGSVALLALVSFKFRGKWATKAYPFFCPLPPLMFMYGIYDLTKGSGLGAMAYLFWILVSWAVSAVISVPGLVFWSAEVEPQRRRRLLIALLTASSPISITGLFLVISIPFQIFKS